jgi:glutaminase
MDPPAPDPIVSTGSLPSQARVQSALDDAYARFQTNDEGAPASHYPALAAVPRDLFGLAVAGVSGHVYTAGDADHPFTIMSVAKPFVLALACQAIGIDAVRTRIGVNSTGLPFDSIMAVELHPDRLSNPMVNTGALATTSVIPGTTADAKWRAIQDGLSRFAGRELAVDDEIYRSASASNQRNRGLARFLEAYDRLSFDAVETVDLYTRQSSLAVTARDLAVMGATLADGGVNPLTRERVVEAATCTHVLAIMATAGLYQTSGDWLVDVGLPGKSGVGGGIVAVAPGKGGLGSFAPPLDAAGNSVRGQLAAAFVSRSLGLNLFASVPFERSRAAGVGPSARTADR